MALLSDSRIIQNPACFEDSYQPPQIISRKVQIDEILECLSPARRGQKPINVWLYGKTGTGKTAVIKFILEKFEKETAIPSLYINCWEQDTMFSILDNITSQLRILGAQQQRSDIKLLRIKKYFGEKLFLVALDEIDRPSPKERKAILNGLCSIQNCGLICASNSREPFYLLEDRLKSRLNPRIIKFEPYTTQEIIKILEERARDCLQEGTWSERTLERIASLSEGDSRIAIQTLRNAAVFADKEMCNFIERKFIIKGWHDIKYVSESHKLKRLTDDHRILYELIKDQRQVQSGDLWNLYLNRCSTLRRTPISPRTFSEYVNKLRDAGLIEIRRARVKGKVRVFCIPEDIRSH